jgi:hypothetical protein
LKIAAATASSLSMTSFGIPLTVKVINSGKAQAMHYADMEFYLDIVISCRG